MPSPPWAGLIFTYAKEGEWVEEGSHADWSFSYTNISPEHSCTGGRTDLISVQPQTTAASVKTRNHDSFCKAKLHKASAFCCGLAPTRMRGRDAPACRPPKNFHQETQYYRDSEALKRTFLLSTNAKRCFSIQTRKGKNGPHKSLFCHFFFTIVTLVIEAESARRLL